MLYTYRYNVLERNGKVVKETEKIDAAGWLDYLKAHTDRYGNLHEFIESSFPDLNRENPLIAASVAGQIDDIFGDREPTAVFQFTLYCWEALLADRIPAGAWAAALATAWQCGERSMLDHVLLDQALVIRMFQAADREALFRVGASLKDWDTYFGTLPENVTIYRGISTGNREMENGLSWTLDPERAKYFAGHNVRVASEIPGVIHAVVPREAILAVFEPGQELVVNPDFPKQQVTTNFLNGPGLAKFRQNWKKWKADEAKRIQEAKKAH